MVALMAYALMIMPGGRAVPRSILLLYPLLLLLLMGGARLAWRMWREYRNQRHPGRALCVVRPVVVVGAGAAGMLLLRELAHGARWRVVALIDEDPAKRGLELSGTRVAGDLAQLPSIMARHDTRDVILAMPSAAPHDLRRVSKTALAAGAQLFTVPSLAELLTGRAAIQATRSVRIEDLLGREVVSLDLEPIRALLAGKRVLVTGAGGSIGSELCRQLARFGLRQLVLLDVSEFALYGIEQWFAEEQPQVDIAPLVGDVKDVQTMRALFERWQPQVVFHAAAYKHVPLMEERNTWQAVRNNAWGTLVMAVCAQEAGAERFVLISTDKAVNPTNVMGASKRLAEMLCESLQMQRRDGTVIQMVRFGNVLGSAGSVIPKFRHQISHGGPVTVTHPDITRFFMSIPEAAQLVLQASTLGRGGEVFVLDMGEPVRIADLARNMIALSGYEPDEIAITYTGLRPGEKLYEEVLADSEKVTATPHPKLFVARPEPVPEDFFEEARAWLAGSAPLADDLVRAQLRYWIPQYRPAGSGTGSSGRRSRAHAAHARAAHDDAPPALARDQTMHLNNSGS